MQIGIAAYLRNLAVRLNEIGRTGDETIRDRLLAISTELADKAEVLERAFRIAQSRGCNSDEH